MGAGAGGFGAGAGGAWVTGAAGGGVTGRGVYDRTGAFAVTGLALGRVVGEVPLGCFTLWAAPLA